MNPLANRPEPPPSVESTLDLFEQWIQSTAQLSKLTASAYRNDVKLYLHWQKNNNIPYESIQSEVTRYLAHQSTTTARAPNTLDRYRASLSAYLRSLGETPLIDFHVTPHSPLPRALAPEEVRAIESTLETGLSYGRNAPWLHERDRLAFSLLYGAGLRVSELIELSWKSVFMSDGAIRVTGKGQKERLIPLPPPTLRRLEQMRPKAQSYFGSSILNGPVLLTERGAKWSRKGVFYWTKKLALESGLTPERLSPHVLRHTYATDCLRNGMNIRALQLLLGHENLDTTAIYADINNFELVEELQRAHPKGQKK